MNTQNIKEENKQLKQRLQRVHISVGISFSILMYISVFFGIFGILLPFIQVWEKPSRHYQVLDSHKIDYSTMIDRVLADPDYPSINGVDISLPSGNRNDPSLKISAKFTKPKVFNPNTNKEVQDEGEATRLAWFLNSMHYGRPLGEVGGLIFGFMGVAGMLLVVGGLILVLKIKYNQGKNVTSKFSKWHRQIFTWLSPPFIIIILTGALLNIGGLLSAPMTLFVSQGKYSNPYYLTVKESEKIAKKNDNVAMLSMNELIHKAHKINPDINFQKIKLTHWKGADARMKISGYNPYMPFLNGIKNKPSITLSGVDGRLLKQNKVLDKHWSELVYDSTFFLHFLFGVDVFTRLFIASIMAILGIALGFGVLLWLEKKARKFPKDIPVYQGMGKLSLATMIGVIPATGLMFFLQWILPFDMIDRFLWHKGLFAVCWVGTLTWSFYRLNSYQTAKEFLFLGGFFFFLSPFIHFYSSGFSPLQMWNENMNSILGVDIGLFIFGSILLFIGYILPKDRKDVQKFWKKIL